MATEIELERIVHLRLPVDVLLSLGPLRHGIADPTMWVDGPDLWRATRTPEGPGTLRLRTAGERTVRAAAWGPGASWLLETCPELLGSLDDPGSFEPRHGVVRELQPRVPGLRFGRSRAVVEALVPAIIEQKVTGAEARAAYQGLVRRYGEPAPGPGRLMLQPEPRRLAALPSYELHSLGLERRRAETVRRVAARADRLEGIVDLPADEGQRRLRAVPGIGPWTAAEVARAALGDPDAVSVGDYHLPDLVSWLLAGEPRGDDARMLELLEPYRGQRARVVRLLELSGQMPPKHGPRLGPRRIASL